MTMVYLTALVVGGATILGSVLGFCFKHLSHRFSDIVLAFAAGVMLSASILGLILPAISYLQDKEIGICLLGIMCGACFMSLLDRMVPHIHQLLGWENEIVSQKKQIDRAILFLLAMAIHNLPEGLAAGVSFGTDDPRTAFFIAGGIALQNIPEGLVTVATMLSAGIPAKKTLLCGVMTGVIEIFGTLLGYFAITVSAVVLPFLLSFAGGTMLFVVSDEMIPETHDHGNQRAATFAILVGFCFMLLSDVLLQ